MPRTADDTWDIVTSVGATALAVAAMRAVEARKPEPLARDVYAQYFVTATASQAPAFAELLDDPETANEPDVVLFSSCLGARTRYFDEFVGDAAMSGIRQVVILAAGLDVRGYRLPWPAGTTVYELDLPKVLDFKAQVLRRHGVDQTATVVALPVDLRDDWPTVLTNAGFNSSEPTAWLAEGLLPFLPGAAQDLLFERVTELSAPASRFAVEESAVPDDQAAGRAEDTPIQGGAVQRMFASILDEGAGPSTLGFDDERADPEAWLTEHGWTGEATTAGDLLVRFDRSFGAADYAFIATMHKTRYFTAVLPGVHPNRG